MDYKETIWVTGCKRLSRSRNRQALKGRHGKTPLLAPPDMRLMVTDPERIDAFAQDLRPDGYQLCRHFARGNRPVQPHPCLRSQRSWRSQRCALAATMFWRHLWCRSQQMTCSTQLRVQNLPTKFDSPTPETLLASANLQREYECIHRETDTSAQSPIIRSSWVYSIDGGQEERTTRCSCRQKPLLHASISLLRQPLFPPMWTTQSKTINRKATGILHVTSRGMASRYEFSLSHFSILVATMPHHLGTRIRSGYRRAG